MKKVISILLALVAVLTALTSFSACGKEEKEANTLNIYFTEAMDIANIRVEVSTNYIPYAYLNIPISDNISSPYVVELGDWYGWTECNVTLYNSQGSIITAESFVNHPCDRIDLKFDVESFAMDYVGADDETHGNIISAEAEP